MILGLDRTDLSAIASTVVAVVGVVASLKIDPTIGTVTTAVGVIATTGFGYLKARRAEAATRKNAIDVANISAGATIDTNAKTVLVQTVTAERAKWRSELREVVTELTALLRASARGETFEWQEVDRLRGGVRLRLNPKGRGAAPTGVDEHPLDRLIHADLDALGQTGPAGTGQHDGIADRLELHMADLLKQEWDVSKDEAVTGKLKGG
ncbi:hypothetical protein [Sphingomonas sp. Leaf30]|uniref:hypothetical protein n=1 Tax=Sphingomonas sp. Leaf30 TaxID=1736213 RepID=UPI0006FE6028|nr:hypothetical protein [Sphingomonas sp. Leaf30]KQN14082.1 hypothetical protein ASE89_10000 [Sphingomonas sp. Leaf30]